MRAARLWPLLAVAVAGCLASKNDIVLLQGEIRTSRDAAAQADAASRAHIDQVLAQLARSNDSIRAVSTRLSKLAGDVQTDHYEMGRQILQIQELTGQSQRRMQELRASLEERNSQQPAAVTPGDSAKAPAGPGPAQLFQGSLDQLRRGSTSVARTGFEELVRNYPNAEEVPEAMIYIASTYANERNQVAADSVYGLVIQKYPSSPKAATALYKRGLSMRAAGQAANAKAAFERVIKDFPRSDEATLARDQLRTLR
ncbi:MAG: tetratricopeptide repeat protein [Gemmatimonadaceae bacterium]